MLVNLEDNPLKFSTEVQITVEPQANKSLVIQILDRGPGIAEDKLPEVIKPFYRVENSRKRDTGGTGLGLAISQQLTLKLQGT